MALLVLPGLAVCAYLRQSAQLTLTSLWPEALADWLALGIAFALAKWLLRMYPTKAGLTGFAWVAGILTGVAAGATNILVLRQLQQHVPGYPLSWLIQTTSCRYLLFGAAGLLCLAMMAANKRVEELDARFRRQQDAEGLLREAELLKLRQQLQPHFLFNSLNSISSLILISPDKAQEMTGQLAHFLRLSINRDGREALPVAEEIEYIEAYLAIEAIRFGDRLQIIFEKEHLEDMRIPSHLIQPLVENAVKYGLQCAGGQIPVLIKLTGGAQLLTISIRNPFSADALPQKGAGFGLEGVRRRLYLLYGRADLLETAAADDSFTVILKIPQIHVSLPDNR